MYLIGYLPQDTVLVFKVGKRFTQKKQEQCASILLKFVKENYNIDPEYLTIERAINTIKSFDRYNHFTLNESGGFSTESSTSVGLNNDNIHVFDITG